MRLVSSANKGFWLAWFIVLAHACAGDVDRLTLASQTTDMQGALDAMRSELEAHDRSVQSSREPADIGELERQHMEAIVIELRGLREAQHGIALCGQHLSIAHHRHELDRLIEQNATLGELIEQSYREVGRHWRAMDEAVVRQSMLDEEREYGRVMATLLSDMRAGSDAIRSALGSSRKGGSMKCPAYTSSDER